MEAPTIPTLLEVERALYAKSYYHFFVAAFAALFPGETFSDNWHIKATCDLLQQEFERMAAGLPRQHNLIVNMPYRSAKSLIFSVMLPAWAWVVRPSTKFICVSYGQDLANELSRQARNLMATEWYQQRWGQDWQFVGDARRIELYANTHGGFRKSVGAGGQITGSGADMILLDDPQDPKLAASKVERENTIKFYRDTLYSRLNKLESGSRILVQQRLHDEDLTGYLLKQGGGRYRHVCVPAELTGDLSPTAWATYYTDGLFWPTRFTRKVLDEIRAEQGATVYANQLLQKPSPAEGGLLKKQWFQTCSWADFTAITRGQEVVWDFDLDTAYTAKARNDPSAYLVSTLVENTLYIRCAGEVRLEAPQLLKFINDLAEQQGYTSASKLYIEPKASGLTIVQLIRNTTQLNVVEAPAPATDKVTRVSAAAPFVEGRRVVLIEGPWVEAFVAQCTGFPNAPHDDMVDCFTQRVARAQKPAKRGKSHVFLMGSILDAFKSLVFVQDAPAAVETKATPTVSIVPAVNYPQLRVLNQTTLNPLVQPASNPVFLSILGRIQAAARVVDWKAVWVKAADGTETDMPGSPLARLLSRPNPDQTWAAFINQYLTRLLQHGNVFIHCQRVLPPSNNEGQILELRIMPAATEIMGGQDWRTPMVGYKAPRAGGSYEVLTADEVLHVKKWQLTDNDPYGVSPVTAAALQLQNLTEATRQRIKQLAAGGPNVLLFGKESEQLKPLTQAQGDDLVRKVTGREKMTYVEGEYGTVQAGLSPVDLDIINSVKLDAGQVADVLNFPAQLLSTSEGNTFSNVGEATKSLYNDCTLPLLWELMDGLNHKLNGSYANNYQVRIDTSSVESLKPNLAPMLTALEGVSYLTLNEKRVQVGQPVLPEGDTFQLPNTKRIVADLKPTPEPVPAATPEAGATDGNAPQNAA